MRRSLFTRLLCTVAVVVTGMIGLAGPSAAAEPPPDATLDLPAGQGCDFALKVEIRGSSQVNKEFIRPDGSIRAVSAGKGSALTFINADSGTTYRLEANGAFSRVTTQPDGTKTVLTAGHVVVILFPTDNPAGPSTTLVVGSTVQTVDTLGNTTSIEVHGKTTDICAQLT